MGSPSLAPVLVLAFLSWAWHAHSLLYLHVVLKYGSKQKVIVVPSCLTHVASLPVEKTKEKNIWHFLLLISTIPETNDLRNFS